MPTIEYSPNGRASCQGCHSKICEGQVRVFSKTVSPYERRAFIKKYWHAGCYHNRKIPGLMGFSSLNPQDQKPYLTEEEKRRRFPEDYLPPEERAKLLAQQQQRALELEKMQAEQAKIREQQDRKLFPERFINQEQILAIVKNNKKRKNDNDENDSPDAKKLKSDESIVYFTIVGRSHSPASTTTGQPVKLEREPNNLHDKFAIRVDNSYGTKLGFVKKEIAHKLAPILDKLQKTQEVWAEVTGYTDRFSTPAMMDFHHLDKRPTPKLDVSGVTDDPISKVSAPRRITTSPVYKVSNPYAKSKKTATANPVSAEKD